MTAIIITYITMGKLKNLLIGLATLTLGMIQSCDLTNRDPFEADVWIQLTNSSADTVVYWTSKNLSLAQVLPHTQATRVDYHDKFENTETLTGEIYLKKKGSLNDMDALASYSITADKSAPLLEARFTWNGTVLTRN